MSRPRELLVIICAVVLITSFASHAVMAWLKIETTYGTHWIIGRDYPNRSAFLAGSSLAGDGIAWGPVSDTLKRPFEGWGVAGSSPSEWERFQDLATDSGMTVIVVSPYDLNEQFLSDFRADIVPLRQTAVDLWQSRSEWAFSKRLLSAYPVHYLRALYPTAGRSEGVIVGVREGLSKAMSGIVEAKAESGPTLSFDANAPPAYKQETIADWAPARMLRRLTELRSASQGKHVFNGPKSMAFARMLRRGAAQGELLVVVLPVSPPYSKEFLTPAARGEFDRSLEAAVRVAPSAKWIRLDRRPELDSVDNFWDLVHMNARGQRLATQGLVDELGKSK
jgi:hypothetical protein